MPARTPKTVEGGERVVGKIRSMPRSCRLVQRGEKAACVSTRDQFATNLLRLQQFLNKLRVRRIVFQRENPRGWAVLTSSCSRAAAR